MIKHLYNALPKNRVVEFRTEAMEMLQKARGKMSFSHQAFYKAKNTDKFSDKECADLLEMLYRYGVKRVVEHTIK
jgi:hypothetical protein